MHIGIQLVAPNGTASLCSETTYYLFSNRPGKAGVVLAWFERHKAEWQARMIVLPRQEFEAALLTGKMSAKEEQETLPPWLTKIEGMSIDELEAGRVSPKKSYRDRAAKRYEAIAHLEAENERRLIEAAESPERYVLSRIKANAAESAPRKKCNHRRLFLWYCAYRLHGRRVEALLPSFAGIGNWDRTSRAADAPRLGRPVKRKGARAGHSSIPLKKRILDSFARFSRLKKPMTKVHRDALRLEFGCEFRTTESGYKEPFHPQGKAFPSYQQYRYVVIQEFGLTHVQTVCYGAARVRTKAAASKGSYSEEGANFMERTEADCQYLPELPKQLLSSEPGAPLVICRIVCTTTGYQAGIGCSYRGEKAEAYRLAKFSAAIHKELFCKIVGIPYREEDWPGSGLGPWEIYDRGAGSSPKVSGSGDVAPAIRSLTPSYSGQSKGTVEAAHAREIRTEGQPNHFRSELNVFQLLKREVLWMKAKNHSTDATDRLTPEMTADNVAGNPAAITKYLLARGRSDAVAVPLERAVREFLTPAVFTMKYDGLWLDGMRFSHTHLVPHGLIEGLARNRTVDVNGYVYPLTLNCAWVEIGGMIHEVNPLLRIRDHAEQLNVTLAELGALSDRLRELRAQQREHGMAAMAEAEQQFLAETGLEWDAGERRNGTAPPRRSRRENVPTDVGSRRKSSTA